MVAADNGQGREPTVLDDIINILFEFRNARTVRQVQPSENEIRSLCTASREFFLSQSNLLELEVLSRFVPQAMSLESRNVAAENKERRNGNVTNTPRITQFDWKAEQRHLGILM